MIQIIIFIGNENNRLHNLKSKNLAHLSQDILLSVSLCQFLTRILLFLPIPWQEVLHAYPQIIVDPLDSGVVRVRLSGDAYNRKTLNRVKKTLPKPQVGVCVC